MVGGKTVSEKEVLKSAIAKLKRIINQLETEIISIKESEIFETITDIEDWDVYFNQTKEQLENELENLKLEVKEVNEIKN